MSTGYVFYLLLKAMEERKNQRKKNIKYLEQKARTFKALKSVAWCMSDELFLKLFHIDRLTFKILCDDLHKITSLRGSNIIPLETKVLCALSYLASGSMKRIIGVSRHLSVKTISECVSEVIEHLSNTKMTSKWIKFFHTPAERLNSKAKFNTTYGLPGVVGCIGCTQVAITQPNINPQAYMNHQGFYSFNIQVICDSEMRILHLVSCCGSSKDAQIWTSTNKIEPYLRQLDKAGERNHLLGDLSYPLSPWLMTPVPITKAGSKEETYNRHHFHAHNLINKCFSLLKSKWRRLSTRPLKYDAGFTHKIIFACAVLHNMSLNGPFAALGALADDNGKKLVTTAPHTDDFNRGKATRYLMALRIVK